MLARKTEWIFRSLIHCLRQRGRTAVKGGAAVVRRLDGM
jgi:hypothetical protein